MVEHLGAFGSLVGPFSWRACVFYLKGGLKGKWVLTRGQLKLLSDYISACGISQFSGDSEGEFRCSMVASGGVCKTLWPKKTIKLLNVGDLKNNSISVLPACLQQT